MINLRNAKKLYEVAKENGVELPDSDKKHFYGDSADGSKYGWMFTNTYQIDDIQKYQDWLLPAYTTDELLEWLGDNCYDVSFVSEGAKENRSWHIHGHYSTKSETPADAIAKIAIFLIKNKIIK